MAMDPFFHEKSRQNIENDDRKTIPLKGLPDSGGKFFNDDDGIDPQHSKRCV